MQRSYDELVWSILNESQATMPARTVKVDSFNELHDIVEPIDKGTLFIVSAEPQQLREKLRCEVFAHNYDCFPFGGSQTKEEKDVEFGCPNVDVLAGHLESYFSWFGEIDTVFLLGSSIAVFKMKHTFSVSHILRSNVHEVAVPSALLDLDSECRSNGSSPHISMLTPVSTDKVNIHFTVNAFASNCLSLNGILALLKHVDPAAVLMVRRVNRLGHDGARVIGNYFQKFGRVVRVFMLPLRSRKKSQVLPSKTGFVVMDTAACCKAILATSSEHTVAPEVTVSVGTFVHKGQTEAYVNEY